MKELLREDATALAGRVRQREVTPAELLEAALARAEEVNPKLNAIITPEYLRSVLEAHPEAKIYAIRVDRGLSPPDVLDTVPGTHWGRERGLNDRQYIVPGGGGFGELFNNAER